MHAAPTASPGRHRRPGRTTALLLPLLPVLAVAGLLGAHAVTAPLADAARLASQPHQAVPRNSLTSPSQCAHPGSLSSRRWLPLAIGTKRA